MAITYTKTQWQNGSGQPISKGNLDHIEDGIYNATEGVNTNAAVITSLAAQVNLSGTYSSSEEVPIGTWIDGAIIYRKVITSNGITGNTVDIPHGITGIKRIINFSAVASNNGGTNYPMDNNAFTLQVNQINNTNIRMNVSTGFGTGWVIHYILEYTKSD